MFWTSFSFFGTKIIPRVSLSPLLSLSLLLTSALVSNFAPKSQLQRNLPLPGGFRRLSKLRFQCTSVLVGCLRVCMFSFAFTSVELGLSFWLKWGAIRSKSQVLVGFFVVVVEFWNGGQHEWVVLSGRKCFDFGSTYSLGNNLSFKLDFFFYFQWSVDWFLLVLRVSDHMLWIRREEWWTELSVKECYLCPLSVGRFSLS